eukprot:g14865.t1
MPGTNSQLKPHGSNSHIAVSSRAPHAAPPLLAGVTTFLTCFRVAMPQVAEHSPDPSEAGVHSLTTQSTAGCEPAPLPLLKGWAYQFIRSSINP